MSETPISIFENVPVMALPDLAARMKRTPEAVTAIVGQLSEQLKDTASRYFIQTPDGWLVTRDGAALIASELRGVRASAALVKILAEFDACQAPAQVAPATPSTSMNAFIEGLTWRSRSIAAEQCERIRDELFALCKKEAITRDELAELSVDFARMPAHMKEKHNFTPESMAQTHYHRMLTKILDREASTALPTQARPGERQ